MTVITPYLEENIRPDVNIVWCATFQMAWDKLKGIEGGPVKTSSETNAVSMLNRESIDQACLPQCGAMSVAGLVGDGVLEDVQARMKKLAGGPIPSLLPPRGSVPENAIIAYAYIERSLPFETPFELLPSRGFGTSDSNVAYFGIEEYSPKPEREREQSDQISIIWHRFLPEQTAGNGQEYIVELLTKEKDDRLLLARIAPATSLKETVKLVMSHVKHPNARTAKDGVAPERKELEKAQPVLTPLPRLYKLLEAVSSYRCLLEGEPVRIPCISFDLTEHFDQLIGLTVVSNNNRLSMNPIADASQRIRFELDNTGAHLESEAWLGVFGGIGMRNFSFDGPFLVLLARKGAKTPYFAAWIGNAELLTGK
jgi:hypothetical protein